MEMVPPEGIKPEQIYEGSETMGDLLKRGERQDA
jgi:hypothetical protein